MPTFLVSFWTVLNIINSFISKEKEPVNFDVTHNGPKKIDTKNGMNI